MKYLVFLSLAGCSPEYYAPLSCEYCDIDGRYEIRAKNIWHTGSLEDQVVCDNNRCKSR